MAADTKDRIVGAGAELFRRQGYSATGVKQIVAEAKAPFGSLYHFFPGGKEQLGAEVIRWSGGMYAQLVGAVIAPAPDILSAVDLFFAGAADTLRETDYEDACPIATVALEVASTSEPLREATAEVFESWIVGLAAPFEAAGLPPDTSRELSVAMLSALEGAFVLCRAQRNTEALEVAGRTMRRVVEHALGHC
ncbi:MAG: TetR/AcrR family transcriptional regulator [Thermoleophilaceae bacterium]